MAEKEIYELETTAAGNTVISSVDGGFPELMARSEVNDSARKLQAAIRRWYDDPEWINFSVRGPEAGDVAAFTPVTAGQFTLLLSGVDLTGYLEAGCILKITNGTSAGVDYVCKVSGTPTYNGSNTTTVNVVDLDGSAGTMNTGTASGVKRFIAKTARSQVFSDSSSDFYIPSSNDSDGINAAIAEAHAAGGGTVLLTASLYTLDSMIDLDTKGNVRLVGALPAVEIRQNPAAGIDPMVRIGNASAQNSIENVYFNANSNAGTIIEVAGQLRGYIRDCVFAYGDNQIEFTSSTSNYFSIERCYFTLWDDFAIVGSGVTDTHTGRIQGCEFAAVARTATDPAAIKLAGQWVIESNRFTGQGHASLTARAIWLWNEGASNGGRKSIISNNKIDGDNAANGYMIEAAGDYIVIEGNQIAAPSAGVGIYIRPTAAGQTAQYIQVDGNVVAGGDCVRALLSGTANASDVSICGNVLNPGSGLTGIECTIDNALIARNLIRGGAVGIEVGATSSDVHVDGNEVINPTADAILITGAAANTLITGNNVTGSPTDGIDVSASATNTRISGNNVGTGVTNPITDASAVSNRMNNSFDDQSNQSYIERLAAAAAVGANLEADVTTGTALDMPCGGGPGRYSFVMGLYMVTPSGNPSARIKIGANGTTADSTIAWQDTSGNIPSGQTFYSGEFTASAGDSKFGVIFFANGSLSDGAFDIDFSSIVMTKIGMD